jgi:hypothetical protein
LLVLCCDINISEHIIQSVECDKAANYSAITKVSHNRRLVLANVEATRRDIAEPVINKVIELFQRVDDVEAVLADANTLNNRSNSSTD